MDYVKETKGYPYDETDLQSDSSFFKKMFDVMEEDDRNQVSDEAKERMMKKISFALQLENAQKKRDEQMKNKENAPSKQMNLHDREGR